MWDIEVPVKVGQQPENLSLEGPAALNEAVNNIEKMAFLPTQESLSFYSRIKITAPVKGELFLVITSALAMEIAKSIYASPEENNLLPKDKVSDTVSELINIIAGQFMKNILPPDMLYTLGLPITTKTKQIDAKSAMIIKFYEINGKSLCVGIKGRELCKLYATSQP